MRHKNNAFGNDLIKCADFPVQQSAALQRPEEGLRHPAAQVAALHKQSALHYAAFCEKADCAFITPIDRRDLLELAAAFHRLSGDLSLLSPPIPSPHSETLSTICRALRDAVAHWLPLGAHTDAPLPYLEKALQAAEAGMGAAAAQRAGLLARSAPASLQRLDVLTRLEAAFRTGGGTADLIRRAQIQND